MIITQTPLRIGLLGGGTDLPGYYRERWEEDMITAFLDGWLTGDPETDEYITTQAWPGWAEVTSVIGLAGRGWATDTLDAALRNPENLLSSTQPVNTGDVGTGSTDGTTGTNSYGIFAQSLGGGGGNGGLAISADAGSSTVAEALLTAPSSCRRASNSASATATG